MPSDPVFHDPGGSRRRTLRRAALALALVAGTIGGAFVLSLLLAPFVPLAPAAAGRGPRAAARGVPSLALPGRERRLDRALFARARAELAGALPAPTPHPLVAAPGAPVVAAFYAPWQETGLHSLRANASRLTHLMPEWLHLSRDGTGLDLSDFDLALTPHNQDVLAIARENGLALLPILNNGEGGRFDPGRVHALLASTGRQRELATKVRDFLVAQRFAGLNLDLENLAPGDSRRLGDFVQVLHDTLAPAGLQLTIDVEAENEELPLERIASLCDLVVLMAYDEHDATGRPGPIASIAWSEKVLRRALESVPADRLLLGLGAYAYDWKEDGGAAESITYQEALIRARDERDEESPEHVVDFDPQALNPTFEYQDDGGSRHEVWLLDAVTAYNQWLLASRRGVRGVALWALGSEDPGVFTVLDRTMARRLPEPSALETIRFPYDVEFEGEGEVLTVRSTPRPGQRRLEVEAATGLVVDEAYLGYPASYVIKRSGYLPGAVALTFDDGPDPDFTPGILDALAALKVPATFFVVGQEVERFPWLVRRAYREGHEIGSHSFTHPNLGAVTEQRARLELVATLRALQATLGRGTLLFRPPYNADAEPASAEEVAPLVVASSLGEYTVGELIDPQDWAPWKPDGAGGLARTTGASISADVETALASVKGNVVLLHDGGGDRSATIDALWRLVPRLKRQGRRFVTVSELVGLSRAEVMPAPAGKDRLLVGFDRVTFEAVFTAERLLRIGFLSSIGLGLARVLLVVPLALVAARRAPRRGPPAPGGKASVLVAAYNERPVIVATVTSALASEGVEVEVVVVDDGSTDGTGDVVEAAFGSDPRVRLVRQENSGKAAALDRAFALARHEVAVCVDADTQLAPDAVARLVAPFADPSVAAVAGNVKVGNPVNVLARWQALEYVTSQNLDRRAYGLLNAVTVVPGAIGAWRRSAVEAAGGHTADTLAEDMDLTWRLRLGGHRIETEPQAIGLTEAPASLGAFFRQRFRWAFGTLQCLVKHRSALFRHGFFGRLALPVLWLFQVLFQAIAPFADLSLLLAAIAFGKAFLARGQYLRDFQPLADAQRTLLSIGFFYALLFLAELLAATLAIRLDRERYGLLLWLLPQRVVYRQLMWAVVWKAVGSALAGRRQGWGKLARHGTVKAP